MLIVDDSMTDDDALLYLYLLKKKTDFDLLEEFSSYLMDRLQYFSSLKKSIWRCIYIHTYIKNAVYLLCMDRYGGTFSPDNVLVYSSRG